MVGAPALGGRVPADWLSAPNPAPLSATHAHILDTVAAELEARPDMRHVRLLDIGCGDGLLLAYLIRALPGRFTDRNFAFFGFDVADHGVQPKDFFEQTRALLDHVDPQTPWRDRLALISEHDTWPYEAGAFEVVVSNQVLEHVADIDLFFGQSARVLVEGGFGLHMFPARHALLEPHLRLPFVHWISDVEARRRVIATMSRAGFGLYRRHRRAAPDLTPDAFALAHVDFFQRFTHFRSFSEFYAACKRARLHASFSYTGSYYTRKLTSLLQRTQTAPPPAVRRSPLGALFWRYVSNVTLLTERRSDYAGPT